MIAKGPDSGTQERNQMKDMEHAVHFSQMKGMEHAVHNPYNPGQMTVGINTTSLK